MGYCGAICCVCGGFLLFWVLFILLAGLWLLLIVIVWRDLIVLFWFLVLVCGVWVCCSLFSVHWSGEFVWVV